MVIITGHPLQKMTVKKFTDNNYPKSYGNMNINFYRLSTFKGRNAAELEKIAEDLWQVILKKQESSKPLSVFKNYKFINSGWEWSVFKKNQETVIKIPAGIFPEVNTARYLSNTLFAYNKVKQYFPGDFIAGSKFYREKNLNIIEQEFLAGKEITVLGYNTKNKTLLNHLKFFLNCALQLLDDYLWYPDLHIDISKNGFNLWNFKFDASGRPKIFDFTAYYDSCRLFRGKRDQEVARQRLILVKFLKWADKRLKN